MAALKPSDKAAVSGAALALVGFAWLLVGRQHGSDRAAFSYLTAYGFAASTAAGALLFLMLGYTVNAAWASSVRRLTEIVASALAPLLLLFVPLVLWASDIYPWLQPSSTLAQPVRRAVEHNHAYLTLRLFVLRTVIYFVIWLVPALLLRRWSMTRAPTSGEDPLDALRRERILSSAMLFPAVLALTFAAFDWLMSLQPDWLSGAFGLYFLVGGSLAALALLTLLAHFGRSAGGLVHVLTPHHFHALGRVLFALTILWAYVGYFQVFLALIADEPREVSVYIARGRGHWANVGPALAVGHFGLPVLLLAPRSWKQSSKFVAGVSGWLLIMHYADLYYWVMPSVSPAQVTPRWLDLAALMAVCGTCIAGCAIMQRKHPWVAGNDPLLPRGVHYRSET